MMELFANHMNLIWVVSMFSTALFSFFIIGLFILYKALNRKIAKHCAIVLLCVSIWSFGRAMFSLSESKELAVFWVRFSYMGSIGLPVFFLRFVYSFLGKKNYRKNFIRFCYFLTGLFWASNFTRLFLLDMTPKLTFPYFDVPGKLLYVYSVFYTVLIIYAHYELFKEYKISTGLKRNQIKYLTLASFIGFGAAGTTFPLVFDIPFYPLGVVLVPFFPLIFAYAIIKYRLMDIRVAVTRAGIFLIVYTIVLGFPFWFGYRTEAWGISLFFMFILATTGPLIYSFLHKKAEDLLMARQRHYQHILLEAAKGMVREHDLNRLLKLIVYVVKRTVNIDFVAIFLVDKETGYYRLRAIRDHGDFPEDFALPYNHPLVSLIKQTKVSLVYEDVNHLLQEHPMKPVHLVIPSFVENNLLGFLVLGEKTDRTIYTEDDINVFEILSRQAALATEYCLFLEESQKTQEKIFAAEKLASIGGMAEGIAHQMKNRLNHFSVVASALRFEIRDFIAKHPQIMDQDPENRRTFEYFIKMTDSLVDNVRRTNETIEGILNFARTEVQETYFSYFSLQEIIELLLEPLRIKHRIDQFPLQMEMDSPDRIYGVKSQILESIYNLLDNSYEAILDKIKFHLTPEEKNIFRPFIKLRLVQSELSSLIEISDNGMGIKDEDIKKIFAPFFTTKSSAKSGTGIGVYVVKRIIEENHKGKIWFESQWRKGTRFFIELPNAKV